MTIFGLLLLAALQTAQPSAPVTIENAIAVAAPLGEDSAGYAALGAGPEGDRLTGAACACAERVEIHRIVRADGDVSMAVEQALPIPAGERTEIRPGSDLHLMLMTLRQPLVAGETVEMVLDFENAGERRVSFAIVEDSAAAWAARPLLAQSLAPLAFLAGSCWRGAFPGGEQTDTHCFTVAPGGFLRDRHIVEGAPQPYSGETLYRWDGEAGAIRYDYYASSGAHSTGTALPAADGLAFPDETHRAPDGTEMIIRSSWARDGNDAYVVLSEAREGQGWRELWRMRMERAGAAPAD